MTNGLIFDIKEFTVHDGPGIRTTVFLKGCPLRCTWCHNPEGQSCSPQWMHGTAGSRLAGQEYSPQQLASLLNRQAGILTACEGGVTFSGGEPLMQAAFLAEVIELLDDLHVLLDTSGYGSPGEFRRLLKLVDLVYFDLKLIDAAAHRQFTGSDNELILQNLQILSESGIPFVIRVPLVPGVTDTDENLAAIAQRVKDLPGLQRVDLLPYNLAAGAKYPAAGMEFQPGYDETRPSNLNTGVFETVGLKVNIV
jgi:pyruvate formate lyase activating enzyme